MKTRFMWKESLPLKDKVFDMPEEELNCTRIQRGDHFEVWTPTEDKDGGSLTYTLKVTKVEYFFDMTFGEPSDVMQEVFLRPT